MDTLPMYGQPEIERSDSLKEEDEEFVEEVVEGVGDRAKASQFYFAKGDEFLNKRSLNYAMRRYNQAWLLNPNNYQPYWGFGRVAIQRGNIDQAIQHLEKAATLIDDPFQEVALLSDIGTVYSYKATAGSMSPKAKLELYKTANQYFQRSTKMDASYPNSWKRWAHSLANQKKYQEAWEKVLQARKLGVRFPKAFIDELKERNVEN